MTPDMGTGLRRKVRVGHRKGCTPLENKKEVAIRTMEAKRQRGIRDEDLKDSQEAEG